MSKVKRLTIIGPRERMVGWSDAIPNREEFTTSTGSLRGTKRYEGLGQLWVYRDDLYHNGAEYFVYSYATPIAWYRGGVWCVPDVKYSNTTTRHQGQVRMALRNRKVES